MRTALIDNSTLTGVQRLLGQIPVKNTMSIDMDILCLESVIEAILFYDQVVIIDDYKADYRSSRIQLFPHINFMELETTSLQHLLSSTASIVAGIVPRVEAGQFSDKDFKAFFDLLKMHVTFTWDMKGSQYFLTQKMLAGLGGVDLEKYGVLSNAIYNELTDKRQTNQNIEPAQSPIFVSRDGVQFTSEHTILDAFGKPRVGTLSKQVRSFFDGLNWLASRTIFYTLLANDLGFDLFLHPIRQPFQVNYLDQLSHRGTSRFKPVIDAMNDKSNDAINKILGDIEPLVTKHRTPMMACWFAKNVVDPHNYIDRAYQLRYERPFIEARESLSQLEAHLNTSNFTSTANSMIGSVDKALQNVVSRYGVGTSQGISTSSFILLWNTATVFKPLLPKLPNIDLRIKQLEFAKSLIPHRGFKSIYKSIVSDLSQVGRLGNYYEIISSKVVVDKEGGKYPAKQEDVRFSTVKSDWKVPM